MGMTKLLWDKETDCVIGGATVGTNAGELLGEICLAIEMGANAEDLALTIHAHPTPARIHWVGSGNVRGNHHRFA